MNNWYKVVAKCEKIAEDGTQKLVTDVFLVDALSHAEAEEKVMKELASLQLPGSIASVKNEKIAEIFFNESGSVIFKAKIYFDIVDQDSGKSKRKYVNVLAQENTIQDAVKSINDNLKDTLDSWGISSISETKICEILKHKYDEISGL